MRYIVGRTRVEYTIGGVRIPKDGYTEKEKARGKRRYVEVSEEAYASIVHTREFQTLYRSGAFSVLSAPPPEAVALQPVAPAIPVETKVEKRRKAYRKVKGLTETVAPESVE
jgi:hypothetical protein